MAAPELGPVSHVALSVSDLERSLEWYGRVLGMRELFPYDTADFRRRILGHPGGAVVALTQHTTTAADAAFDHARVGLDHLSLGVGSQDALAAWTAHLDEHGVEHAGVQLTPATGSALVAFHDPDGIQLELYVQTGAPTG